MSDMGLGLCGGGGRLSAELGTRIVAVKAETMGSAKVFVLRGGAMGGG